MRSLFVSALTALTALMPLTGVALAREEMQPPLPLTIDFETQGCGRFRTVAYYRTEFQFVNVCVGEASLIMVVTDNDGLGRERVPVEKITTPAGVRFVGKSDRGIEYAIDNQTLTILFPDQKPYQEKVQKVSFTGLPQVKPVSQSGTKPMNTATVTGTVAYRQRIALLPNAIVKVKLQDVSRMDAPAILLDEQTIQTDGKQVPIPFTLKYNPSQIQDKSSYAVSAEIWVGNKREWISTTRNAVISQGKPTTNITVVVGPIR